MSAEICIAIITGIFTLFGTIITVKQQTDLTIYRINQLEKKQSRFNNVIERTFILEEQMRETKEAINELKEKR